MKAALPGRKLLRQEPWLDGSGEEGHLLVKALLGLGDLVSNVNLSNRGQIENCPGTPWWRPTRCPAWKSPHCCRAAAPGRPRTGGPPGAGPGKHGAGRHDLRLSLALATFLSDPQLSALSPREGERMFGEMLQNTKEYLPKGWLGSVL